MNLPQPSPLPPAQSANMLPSDDNDGINLLGMLDVVIEQRWLIAIVTALALAYGSVTAYLATPIFVANTLIQVEDIKGGGLGSLLGDTFDIKSPSSAEIEILRSRLVVGQAVSNLQLDLSVSPKYLPVVGQWMSRRANAPSTPGFMGLEGYVSGNESLQVGYFKAPRELQGAQFSVVLSAQGYTLRLSDGPVLGQGRFGEALLFKHNGATGELLLTSATGLPGAEFFISRASHLGKTQQLQRSLSIAEQGRSSGVLNVSLEGSDPALAARTLNEIGTLYVRQNVERKAAEAEKSIAFLNTQLPQLREELESSESKFNQFRNQNGIFELGAEAQTVLSRVVDLRVNLLGLQQKRKDLDSRFTTQHPSMQVLDAQIKDISAQINSLEGKSKTFPSVEQDLLRLTRDVKVNSDLYTGLLNSFQQLRLVKEGKVGNVRIVDVAAVPEGAVKPDRRRMVMIAGVLGLLAGLGLAYLRNSLRPGIRTAEDIEQHLGLHVFATVPHSQLQGELARNIAAKKPGIQLLASSDPTDASVESLRSLRTALQFAMLDAPNNIVLITGATPGIGKSFTSANFAAVLGTGGKRVLFVDADMRKGHAHQFFGLARGHGLSELITGSSKLTDVLHRGVSPLVDLITTGTLPPNPAELLMSPSTVQLLHELSDQYDIVLIDTPPVLAVSDTQVIAPQAGTVFMVARADVSTLGELQESTKRLMQSGVTVRGVIFNDLNLSKRRYGYGYGMGYKYGRYRYTNYKY